MIDKIRRFVSEKKLIQEGDRIVAGFSGGADSLCLLLILKELKKQFAFDFCGVHVEHGIRGAESLEDAQFARQFCAKQGIAFFCCPVDAPGRAAQTGKSLEEVARELRYECFEQVRKTWNGTKIAVAHHADDQAETVLFHLCRGSGIQGLRGMLPQRDGIIRPLLCVSREEIEQYLSECKQSFCTDSTNLETAYARNRIRNLVLPQLEQVNTQTVSHIVQTAEHLGEVWEYLEQETMRLGRNCVQVQWSVGGEWKRWMGCHPSQVPDGRNDIPNVFVAGSMQGVQGISQPHKIHVRREEFLQAPFVLQKQLLLNLLGFAAGSRRDFGTVHVDALLKLFDTTEEKTLDLPYHLKARSGYEAVELFRDDRQKQEGSMEELLTDGTEQKKLLADATEQTELLTNGTEMLLANGMKIRCRVLDFSGNCKKIPLKTYTKWFDYDKIINTVFLRTRKTEDYLVVNAAGGRKKLKDYFINEKIPKHMRDEIPLLADGSHILWVIGYRISEFYKVTQETKRILEVCVDGGIDHE